MELSDNGYNFISQMEGVRNKAYKDSIGKLTIGIGFIEVDGHPVTEGMTLTNEQIKEQFFQQITRYEDAVNSSVTSDINQNQFDALTSFTFNLGSASLKSSTLLKKVNINPQDPSIATEFAKWNKAGGKVIDGLSKRRAAESNLYFS